MAPPAKAETTPAETPAQWTGQHWTAERSPNARLALVESVHGWVDCAWLEPAYRAAPRSDPSTFCGQAARFFAALSGQQQAGSGLALLASGHFHSRHLY